MTTLDLSNISTNLLKETVKLFFYSKEDSSIIAMIDILAELEKRIPKQEFADFCDSIK